jgi:hypothetical protein
MKRIEVEILSESVNSPVVRTPGRKFPGVIIQGDSLKNILSLSEEVYGLSRKIKDSEIEDLALELRDLLGAYLAEYEAAVKANNLELPYPSK